MLQSKQIKRLTAKIEDMPDQSAKKYYAKLLMDSIRYRMENYQLERYQPYEHQKKIHTDTSKVRGLYGANRMGKTHCGIMEVCMHATGMYPRWWPEENKLNQPVQIWCVIETFKKSQSAGNGAGSGSTHGDKIEQAIGPEIERRPTRQKKRYLLKNGSVIHLKTYKQGRASFESESIPFIYFDEECPEDIYNAGMARTIDCGGRILITLTGVEGAKWFHKLIEKDKQGDPDVCVINDNIWANKSLSESEIEKVRQQYSGREKMIRIEGAWIPGEGRPVFDPQIVEEFREAAEPGKKMKILTDIESPDIIDADEAVKVGVETVPIRIWQMPKKGTNYLISCDPGGTSKTSSRSAAHVMNRNTETIVGELSAKPTQLQLARALFALGIIYNDAIINVETNKGEAVVQFLTENNYPKMYYDPKPLRPGQTEKRPGFMMTRTNRVRIIENLKDRLENKHLHLLCKRTLDELASFVVTESGKKKAQYGTHDDLVISLALAELAHLQSAMYDANRVEEFLYNETKSSSGPSPDSISPSQVGGKDMEMSEI